MDARAGLDACDVTVAVRAPNWLGDTVMALPALRALRTALPRARIAVIGRWAPLLAGQGVGDLLLAYPSGLGARHRFARAIGAERPQLAILLANSLEAAIAAWWWRASRRWGFDTDGRSPLLTHAVPLPEPRLHQVDEYAALLAPLGITVPVSRPEWRLAPDREAESEVRALLDGGAEPRGGPLVGLHLGAAFGSSKLWPAESFGSLARRLEESGARPLLLGTVADQPAAAAVINAAGARLPSLVGRDRPELLPRLLSRLSCLVSGDTGVAHLAAAVGVPTVTLFGPTDRRLTAPRGDAARVLDREAPCSPCFLPICPIDHICLRRITPEAVLYQVKGVLAA